MIPRAALRTLALLASAALLAPLATASPARAQGATAARPAPGAPEPAEVAKVNLYVGVQNSMITWPLAKELSDHFRDNSPKLKRAGPISWYMFGVSDFDSKIERLKKARAMPAGVPGLDAAADRLLAAMEGLNPVVKELKRYKDTEEFKEDGGKLARERDGAFVSGMRAAVAAQEGFEAALGAYEQERDERRLAAMAPESLPARLLRVSIASRRAAGRLEALAPKADVAPFLAGVEEVKRANDELRKALDAQGAAADSYCKSYSGDVDGFVGNGRGLARDLRSGGNPGQNAEAFTRTYNRGVENLTRCREKTAAAG